MLFALWELQEYTMACYYKTISSKPKLINET